MATSLPVNPPTRIEAVLNRLFGWLVGHGLMPGPFYLLEVRGRKSGRLHSTPVDLLLHGGRRYLVAPRGHTQWARNARVSGTVTLRRGRVADRYTVRELADSEKPNILKAYLDAFKIRVQRFFPLAAGSPVEAFRPLAERYPAFELTASGDGPVG
jgi:deazaflavin-dependent oxidoreductase (nitroreductase family)